MKTRYEIRFMEEDDLAEVADLERRTFPVPWSREAFRHEVLDNPNARSYVVRTADGAIAAYACAWVVEDELLINNLTVAPDHRSRGLGRRLLGHLLDSGLEAGCRTAALEVRPSNEPALRLYRGLGFRPIGRRRRYYRDGEDALVMGRDLEARDARSGPG